MGPVIAQISTTAKAIRNANGVPVQLAVLFAKRANKPDDLSGALVREELGSMPFNKPSMPAGGVESLRLYPSSAEESRPEPGSQSFRQ